MRLACPGCGAQYEVDAAAIPDGGREVQCSACGHRWFQYAQLTAAVAEAPMSLVQPMAAAQPEPVRSPADFRTILREEAAREAVERRREGVPPPVAPAPAMRPNRGFMTGLLLAAIPLALAAGAYAGAPRLEREVPALAQPLATYVAHVDDLRVMLDDWLQRARSAR